MAKSVQQHRQHAAPAGAACDGVLRGAAGGAAASLHCTQGAAHTAALQCGLLHRQVSDPRSTCSLHCKHMKHLHSRNV